MKRGFWLNKNKISNIYPYISRNMDCDVIVVGGGICGAITSYFLAKDGFKVVVLEKNIIGYKNTSLSSACITDFIDDLYIKNSKEMNDNVRRKLAELKRKANSLLDEILVDIQKQEYIKKVDYNILNGRLFQKGMLKNEVNIRENIGEKAELIDNLEYINTNSGINLKNGARMIDSYDFTSKVFEYISAFPNVYIFENTKLRNVHTCYDYVEVTTQNDFKITGGSLILTTGIDILPISNLPNIEVYKRFSLALNTNLNKRICSKVLNDIPIYVRNDEKGNMVVSGIDTKYIVKMENSKYLEMLENDNEKKLKSVILKLFPKLEVSKEIGIYSGNIYVTKDGMPLIGEIEEVPNTYINLGIGSSSIAQMLVGADILKDAIKGYYKKEMNLFKIRR